MRELLSELKSEQGDGTPHSSISPFSRESASQPAENNPAMDLINRIQVNDGEGRSRQRVLEFAARNVSGSEDISCNSIGMLVPQREIHTIMMHYTTGHLFSRKVLIMSAQILFHLLKMICSRKLVRSTMRQLISAPRFMMAKMRGRTKEAEELWEQVSNILGLAGPHRNRNRNLSFLPIHSIQIITSFQQTLQNLLPLAKNRTQT